MNDLPSNIHTLYQYKNGKWLVKGYKCPYCEKHFFTASAALPKHIEKCKEKLEKKNAST